MKDPKNFEHHFLDANGARLHYVEGPCRDMPLVLIPGQTMPWQSYMKVLPSLSEKFHCLAMDVRGHGLSSHTPGNYSFSTLGKDLICLLEQVVKKPSIVSGNSSGGIIATYAAAHAPHLVCGAIPEDPPLFSSEWPELKNCYVYHVFANCVKFLERPERDLRGFFLNFKVPIKKGQRIMRAPRSIIRLIAWLVNRYQKKNPDQPVNIGFLPFQFRLFLKGLSEYDPAFTNAFLDGSACDIDHEKMLQSIQCPVLLLQADWFIHESLGLVGAMSDLQAARAVSCIKDCNFKRIKSGHVIHQEKADLFVRLVTDFALDHGLLKR